MLNYFCCLVYLLDLAGQILRGYVAALSLVLNIVFLIITLKVVAHL